MTTIADGPRTLAEKVAELPASARLLLSELSGLDLNPLPQESLDGLRGYRRTLLDARVRTDFDARDEIDANWPRSIRTSPRVPAALVCR